MGSMKEGLREKFFKGFTVTLVLVILIGGLVVAWPDYQRRQAILEKDLELSTLIEEKKAAIEELKKNQERFSTDRDFVEAIARQNNRVFPGELVFIFEKED